MERPRDARLCDSRVVGVVVMQKGCEQKGLVYESSAEELTVTCRRWPLAGRGRSGEGVGWRVVLCKNGNALVFPLEPGADIVFPFYIPVSFLAFNLVLPKSAVRFAMHTYPRPSVPYCLQSPRDDDLPNPTRAKSMSADHRRHQRQRRYQHSPLTCPSYQLRASATPCRTLGQSLPRNWPSSCTCRARSSPPTKRGAMSCVSPYLLALVPCPRHMTSLPLTCNSRI